MKILLVKNPTNYLHYVTNSLKGHDIEVLEYKPGVKFDTSDKDLVILSGGGGEGFEATDKHDDGKLFYHDELEFIKTCDKPLIGICLGFELIAHAHGSKIETLKIGVKGPTSFKDKSGRTLKQMQWHDFAVREIDPEHFEILAESDTGIEIIKHKKRPILATQFHPERGGSLQLTDLVNQLLPASKSL